MKLDEDKLQSDIDKVMGPWLDSLSEDELLKQARSVGISSGFSSRSDSGKKFPQKPSSKKSSLVSEK